MANGGRGIGRMAVSGSLQGASALAGAADDASSVSSYSDSGFYSDVSSISTLADILNRYTITYEPEYSVKVRKGCADHLKFDFTMNCAE